MLNSTELSTVLLVSKNQAVIEATQACISAVESLRLIDNLVTPENLIKVIAETKPNVILLDFDYQTSPFILIDSIASRYPGSAVISILPESELLNSDKVVLSGARAFLLFPYRADTLATTIQRTVELMMRHQNYSQQVPDQEEEIASSNFITVFSPKGGVGTTTIATNLAISLHKTLKEDVLLVDGKHLFGHAALYLNLRTGNSINDLIAHAGFLDQRLIKQVVIKHISGIHVLPSPISIPEGQGIRPENLFKVIQSLQQTFPHIIVDGGNNLNENTVTYMDSSDRILLVMSPDLASMRDAKQFMEIAGSLSYSKEKTLLILNVAGRKADVKKEQIEAILKMNIFGTIPADENSALSSLNEGIPIILKNPRHPISKAISEITKDLIKNIQSSKGESSEQAESGKNSLFGKINLNRG